MIEHLQDIDIRQPNRLVCRFFYGVTRFMMRRRFNHVYVNKIPELDSDRSIVAIQNHHTWWDGLLPLFFSERYFPNHTGLALMEDIQMEKHGFFKYIGAQPVSRSNHRLALAMLSKLSDYVRSRPSVIFVYPQGAVYPNDPTYFEFESGYRWLSKRIEQKKVLVITTYTHSLWNSKPDLLIDFTIADLGTDTESLEMKMSQQLNVLQESALDQHEGLTQIL